MIPYRHIASRTPNSNSERLLEYVTMTDTCPSVKPRICLVIPALNEAPAIGKVLDEVPRELVDEITVVDNGSTDETSNVATAHGAKVIFEPRKGYGSACLAGIRSLQETAPEIVVFMDGDYSSEPKEIDKIIKPILKDNADMVIGCRESSRMEKGLMPFHAKCGNRLAMILIRLLHGRSFSDPGPFRAISWRNLESLNMKDQRYGWNVEMMIKAVKMNLRIVEVEVSYRKRIGKSKISGSLVSSIKAGYHIISKIIRYSID